MCIEACGAQAADNQLKKRKEAILDQLGRLDERLVQVCASAAAAV